MRKRLDCVSSEPVLRNRWITVRRDRYRFDGSADEIDYYVTDTADIVLVVPTTRRGRFILVRQWKLPIGQSSLEFPAGAIGRGSPLANAKRELLEETGFAGGRWRKLGSVFRIPAAAGTAFTSMRPAPCGGSGSRGRTKWSRRASSAPSRWAAVSSPSG